MDKDLQKKTLAFYILVALYSCFFATGNWYFLWKLYLTNKGIGVVDALAFAAGLLFEIPSGAIADMFGRRKTIFVAVIMMGLGYTVTGFAISGGMILTGYLVYAIGAAFFSGSDDALMFDILKKNKQEHLWKKIVTNKYIVSRIAALSATIIGGLLFTLSVRIPSIARGIFFILMVLPLVALPENYGKQSIGKFSWKEYFMHTIDGMKQLILPSIIKLLPLFIVVGGIVDTLYVGGILRPILLARAGYGGQAQSYIIGLAGIITTIILLIYKRNLSTFSDQFFTWILSIVALLSFVALGIIPSNLWLPLLIVIQIIQGLFMPTQSDFINHKIDSAHRATALSTIALVQDIPYVVAGPVIGILVDKSAYQTINLSICAFIAIGIILALILRLRTNKIVSRL